MKKRLLPVMMFGLVSISCSTVGVLFGPGQTPDEPTGTASPATVVTQEPTSPTPTSGSTEAAPSGQEGLREEWRPAIQNAILLFSICEVMFETHFKYSEGEIDQQQARAELEIEGDFLEFPAHGLSSGDVPSEAVAPYLLRLEREMQTLIGLVDPIDRDAIGSVEVLDTLSATCQTLNGLQGEVVSASMEAGLSEASVDELDQGVTPMINDMYEMVQAQE